MWTKKIVWRGPQLEQVPRFNASPFAVCCCLLLAPLVSKHTDLETGFVITVRTGLVSWLMSSFRPLPPESTQLDNCFFHCNPWQLVFLNEHIIWHREILVTSQLQFIKTKISSSSCQRSTFPCKFQFTNLPRLPWTLQTRWLTLKFVERSISEHNAWQTLFGAGNIKTGEINLILKPSGIFSIRDVWVCKHVYKSSQIIYKKCVEVGGICVMCSRPKW